MMNRRNFIQTTVFAGAGLTLTSAKSYGNIAGANDRIRVGVIGVNSRGYHLSANFASQKDAGIHSKLILQTDKF